jgi:hypothetical protein
MSTETLFNRRQLLVGAAAGTALAATPGVVHAFPGGSHSGGSTNKYRKAAMRGVKRLADQIRPDGSYGPNVPDLASYYKSTWLMHLAGRNHQAYEILGHIERTYLQPDGDFVIADGVKSENGVFNEYWPYINTWIAMASQKMGRFDLARKAYDYVRGYYHEELGAFTLRAPYNAGDNEVEGFITAHLGLASLYFGELDRARAAGDFLCHLLELQPDISQSLYFRVDTYGELITQAPPGFEALAVIHAAEPYQLYFLVGYPIAFLAKLYDATGESKYLDGSRAYLAFALSCHETVYSFYFSHKLAWAASQVARLTGDDDAELMARRIADYLLEIQESDGLWLSNEPNHTSYDQSAEICTWLLELSAELGG